MLSNTPNTGANTGSPAEQAPSLNLTTSTSYLCNSCNISFQNGQEQRTHMKQPWHVCNVKRRIASLPPISLAEFDEQAENKIDTDEVPSSTRRSAKETTSSNRNKSRSRSPSGDEQFSDNESEESEESVSPFQCLFCNQDFPIDDAGFAANLEHMRAAHGMQIPDPEMVADMQSFVGYLATEVRIWHECLYCGAMKPSTASIQSHMRDKSHCTLNFDREPELLEFWDKQRSVNEDNEPVLEQEHAINLSETEIRFASGKVIGSRHAPGTKKASRRQGPTEPTAGALTPGSEDAQSAALLAVGPQLPPPPPQGTQLPSSRQLARRDEMSIQGISIQQRRALVLAEKKAQRSEAMARRAREWVYAKGANAQEFDQLDCSKLKWGKQNHKMLPR